MNGTFLKITLWYKKNLIKFDQLLHYRMDFTNWVPT